MKKILFILHLPPPVHGAAVVGETIRRSEAVNGTFACRYVNLSTSDSIGDIGKASIKKVTSIMRLWKSVREELKDFRPDLVYVTASSSGLGFLKDFLLVRQVKRAGYRVVVHFHNKGVSRRKDFLFRWLYSGFFRDIRVIQLSEKLYPDIAAYVPRENVRFCANGVSDPGPVLREEHAVPHILFCSNLIESKGILVLLDACRILLDRGARFVLDIAGGESSRITYVSLREELSRRGLTETTVCHGRVSGDGKEEVFRGADIFVLPTFEDCFPIVILESMARGLPVVSTDEGAVTEMVAVGENGFVVPRKDSVALADALSRLLQDPGLRRRMGDESRKRYQESFTEAAFLSRFISILSAL